MPEFLYGHWAVMEAMRARRRRLDALMIHHRSERRGTIANALNHARDIDLPVQRVQRRILDDLANHGNHQGLVLRVGPYPYCDWQDILSRADKGGEKPFILLLDLLKDPQNVGSLIRVSDAVGVHGIIIQERRSVAVTPAVVRASSGAVEHCYVAQVPNLVNAMKALKERDVWLVGLDVGHDIPPLDKTDLDMSLGLVMGSEGEGLRRLVRDTCDLLLTLPMRGQVGSLNVATAGAIALYRAWSARGWQGWAQG